MWHTLGGSLLSHTHFVMRILQVVGTQWFTRLSCLPSHAGQMHIAQIVNELGGTLWEMVFSVSLSRRLYFVWHALGGSILCGTLRETAFCLTLRYAYPVSCW